jgi:amino acid transporter
MVSPPWCRSLLAWLTGWAFTLGNIIITLSVNFGTSLFLVGCINIFEDSDGNGIFAAKPYQIYLIFIAITLICNLISSLLNKWLPLLDTLTVGFTFCGVLAIIICTLVIAAAGRNSASYAFFHFEPTSGWNPSGWAFCIGLLHAAYATSATGMVVSMCEEVEKPAEQVPKALVGALLLNWACGFVFLVPLMFVIGDLSAVINDPTGQPLPGILKQAIGNQGGAFALTVPIIILGLLCGTSCTTAASRCTWAFARDGAIPGSRVLKLNSVNKKLDVPLNAMMLSMAIQIILGVIYLGSAAAFNAFNGSGVIFLTLSYVMPVAASFFTGRKKLIGARYNFGIFGSFCNVVAMGKCLVWQSGGEWSANMNPSLVRIRNPSLLHAIRPPGLSLRNELRLRGVCGRIGNLLGLVLHLGPQKLHGPESGGWNSRHRTGAFVLGTGAMRRADKPLCVPITYMYISSPRPTSSQMRPVPYLYNQAEPCLETSLPIFT